MTATDAAKSRAGPIAPRETSLRAVPSYPELARAVLAFTDCMIAAVTIFPSAR